MSSFGGNTTSLERIPQNGGQDASSTLGPNAKGFSSATCLPVGSPFDPNQIRTKNHRELRCDDPVCCRRPGTYIPVRPSEESRNVNATEESLRNNCTKKNLFLEGQVIVCLPEPDCEWFQAYLFPHSGGKSIPLLGILQEIDDCLQCADGGYRVIELQVLLPETYTGHPHRISIHNIEWTGGDMMDLKTALPTESETEYDIMSLQMSGVEMKASKLESGEPAARVVQRLFEKLVRKLQNVKRSKKCDSQDLTLDSRAVLEVLPEVSVVSGDMSLLLYLQEDII